MIHNIIITDKATAKEVRKQFSNEAGYFSFEKISSPPSLSSEEEENQWKMKAWGCQSNASCCNFRITKTSCCIFFLTEDAPALPIAVKLSKMFSDAEVRYFYSSEIDPRESGKYLLYGGITAAEETQLSKKDRNRILKRK